MFLDTISKHLEGYSVTLTVKKNSDGTLNILMVPRPDKEIEDKDRSPMLPLNLHGSIEHLNSTEFANEIEGAMVHTKEAVGNINLYQDALTRAADDKKNKAEKKPATTGSTTKKKEETIKKKIDKPNPAFIPEDKRNDENPDWSIEYDVNTPETITETKEVPLQKELI